MGYAQGRVYETGEKAKKVISDYKKEKMSSKNEFYKLLETGVFNVWRYSRFYRPQVLPQFQLTLEEGWTKEVEIPRLTRALGLSRLRFKREDLNPTGSHKARSLAYQVSKYHQEGKKVLIISSSGNAAVSAAAYCNLAGIRLCAFLSPETEKSKMNQIKKFGATTILSRKPINFANYVSRIFEIVNLRPSLDDTSLEGFKSLAFELYEKEIEVDAIFLMPLSASTLVGMGRGFFELQEKFGLKKIPQIHAVQTGAITSIAGGPGEESPGKKETGLAGRLGVKNTGRKKEAAETMETTGGKGWIVDNEEIYRAISRLNDHGIDTSPEGAAVFAGALKAKEQLPLKNILCLLTGHHSQWERDPGGETSTYFVDSYQEVKSFFGAIAGFRGRTLK